MKFFICAIPEQNVLVLRRARPAGKSVLPDLGDLQRRLADTETALTDMTTELAANYESLVAVFRYSSELGAHDGLEGIFPPAAARPDADCRGGRRGVAAGFGGRRKAGDAAGAAGKKNGAARAGRAGG